MSRVVCIVNPRAGRGRGERIAKTLPEALARRGFESEVLLTRAPRDGIHLARTAAESADVVVAVGGDGTAHEVTNGLAEAAGSAALGLIPVGSGNDTALALGIPPSFDSALDILETGTNRRIDLGRFNDGWFVNSIGIGFEAQVTVESRSIQRLRGLAIYLWAVVKALRKLHCADFRVEVDDRCYDGRRLLICVGNGPRVGGGFYLTPDAVNDDGVFDLCLVDAMRHGRLLRTLPKALKGSHTKHPAVTMYRSRVIRIESRDGFPFHADGEVIDTKRHHLEIEIHPRRLNVRTPATQTRSSS